MRGFLCLIGSYAMIVSDLVRILAPDYYTEHNSPIASFNHLIRAMTFLCLGKIESTNLLVQAKEVRS